MRATLTCAVLFAGALAVPPARGEEPTEKELRTARKDLREIAVGIHTAYDTNQVLPGNIASKDGKPLLSWRVAILPFIEGDTLYKTFDLTEPWDGPNNKKLIEKMPKVFAPARGKAKAGETFYRTFTGKDALFGEKGPNFKLSEIPDGLSKTALVVEAGDPVIWTKPDDLPFDPKKPLPKLGGVFDGEFHLLLCDGSVIRVKKGYDEKELKNLVTANDGAAIDFKKLTK
jgi:hypothetical protein